MEVQPAFGSWLYSCSLFLLLSLPGNWLCGGACAQVIPTKGQKL